MNHLPAFWSKSTMESLNPMVWHAVPTPLQSVPVSTGVQSSSPLREKIPIDVLMICT